MAVSLKNSSGFSVMELIVAMLISAIILVLLGKLLTSSQLSYRAQEEIMETNQNAQFTLNKLADVIVEAGALLPSGGWNIIETDASPTDSFKIHFNPKGGYQIIQQASLTTDRIPVHEGAGFNKATKIKYRPLNPAMSSADLTIQTGYNSNGYVKGIKTVANKYDSVKVTANKTFYKGDTLYSYDTQNYYKNGTNLYLNGEVLVENIDTLAITFLDISNASTTSWDNISSVDIQVTTKSLSNNTTTTGDGYRRTTLTKTIRLKNKI